MKRRALLFGLFATSALVNVPAALAVLSPRESLERLIERRLKEAERATYDAIRHQLNEMMWGDGTIPGEGGLLDLLDGEPTDLLPEDRDEPEEGVTYVRYAWSKQSASVCS